MFRKGLLLLFVLLLVAVPAFAQGPPPGGGGTARQYISSMIWWHDVSGCVHTHIYRQSWFCEGSTYHSFKLGDNLIGESILYNAATQSVLHNFGYITEYSNAAHDHHATVNTVTHNYTDTLVMRIEALEQYPGDSIDVVEMSFEPGATDVCDIDYSSVLYGMDENDDIFVQFAHTFYHLSEDEVPTAGCHVEVQERYKAIGGDWDDWSGYMGTYFYLTEGEEALADHQEIVDGGEYAGYLGQLHISPQPIYATTFGRQFRIALVSGSTVLATSKVIEYNAHADAWYEDGNVLPW